MDKNQRGLILSANPISVNDLIDQKIKYDIIGKLSAFSCQSSAVFVITDD